jgi:Tfp pilus assembly protein PilF
VKLWSVNTPPLRPLARAVPALLAVVALVFAVKTVRRNRDWRSNESLYEQTLKTENDAPFIRANLGGVYLDRGDIAGAEREWLAALSSAPNSAISLDDMALLRQRQQRYAESIDYSQRALRSNPISTIEHIHLAETFVLVRRMDEAEREFRAAAALSPLSTTALNGYGKFLFDAGRFEEARTEYERSADADSTSEAYDRLGDIYLSWQDTPRAEQAFRHALAMDPFDGHAHIGLGEVLESAGRPADARHEYKTGLETNPVDPVAKAAVLRLSQKTPVKTISP